MWLQWLQWCFFYPKSDQLFCPAGLRVMALNTWGMPATFGSQDKELRMQAIGEHIARGEHDLYLLSELWMRPDHNTIKSLLPANWTQGGTTGTWHMTTVGNND